MPKVQGKTVKELPQKAEQTRVLFGRRPIYSTAEKITEENVVEELNKAFLIHSINSAEIDYLYWYRRGRQPILGREKKVRPEINNRIVENHAAEIVNFKKGYLLGEPCTYVARGAGETKEVEILNNMMFFRDKASKDMLLCDWFSLCGVGYRQVLPDDSQEAREEGCPLDFDIPDPRYTFVVKSAGFGNRPLMGVRFVLDDDLRLMTAVYTPDQYFLIRGGEIVDRKDLSLGSVCIIEYLGDTSRMGVFEPVLSLLDNLNTAASNRMDGVEQFIQALMIFENCTIDDEGFEKLREAGAIRTKTVPGAPASKVYYLVEQLDQSQIQMLVDYWYQQVLTITGMPLNTKGGSSTSDTGAAVVLRDGWEQAEAGAKTVEGLFKQSEKEFLKIVLRICRSIASMKLKLSDIDVKFTRRQYANLQSKTQALQAMLQAGISPDIAIAQCGLFNDPQDVYERSKPYLEKWEPKEEKALDIPGKTVLSPEEDDPVFPEVKEGIV